MSCVSVFLLESLFLPLSFYLPCLDMFLSPSPKFPSFRERSEVRDSDLPRGWVKDSLPPSPSWEMCCPPPPISLFCIHLSLLSSLGSPDNVQKDSWYSVSASILDWSAGPMGPVVWSHCVGKNKGKKTQLYVLKRDFNSMRWMTLV